MRLDALSLQPLCRGSVVSWSTQRTTRAALRTIKRLIMERSHVLRMRLQAGVLVAVTCCSKRKGPDCGSIGTRMHAHGLTCGSKVESASCHGRLLGGGESEHWRSRLTCSSKNVPPRLQRQCTRENSEEHCAILWDAFEIDDQKAHMMESAMLRPILEPKNRRRASVGFCLRLTKTPSRDPTENTSLGVMTEDHVV